MPIQRGEGPVGIIICPSRELARQTFDIINEYVEALKAGERCSTRRGLERRGSLRQ